MSAILSTFKLNYNEIGVFIDAQQIDASLTILPISEFFGDDQGIWRDHFGMALQQGLQMSLFLHLLICKRRS